MNTTFQRRWILYMYVSVLAMLHSPPLLRRVLFPYYNFSTVHCSRMISCRQPFILQDDGDDKESCLAQSDKEVIKANLVPLMCRAPPEVQRQVKTLLLGSSGDEKKKT